MEILNNENQTLRIRDMEVVLRRSFPCRTRMSKRRRRMRSYLEDVDFETIKQRFDAFWDREVLNRPLIYITAPRKDRMKTKYPVPGSVEEKWTNTEYVLNKMESFLENTLFLGDAIPWYWLNLGPNHFTACLGAGLVFRDEVKSWAEPFLENLSGYDPVLDENSKWWRIMNALLDAMCEMAEGILEAVVCGCR